MKKISMIMFSIAFIATASCDKQPKLNPNATWYVDTANYNATNVQRVTATGSPELMATTSGGNSAIQVFFQSLPTVAGTFKIVDESKAYPNSLAVNECAIEISVGTSGVYNSTGNDNKYATVTFNSGNNMKVSFPTILLYHEPVAPSSVGDTTTGGNGDVSEY